MIANSQLAPPASPLAASPSSPLLTVRDVSKHFGALQVLHNISLEVREGEFLTILGESGSGKTTLLRLIAGFEQLDHGEIWMAGERLDSLPPYRRRVNTVFQQYALFPHLTVFENVAYGLRVQGVSKSETKQRVEAALAMVKMTQWSGSKPAKISGGQQQRVALARALVNHPRMLLLDEPLSALDASLRRQMQSELKSLQRELGITFLFVTHDQDEALTLSDRVAVLRKGKLEQIASPEEIYRRPATAYIAQFIGQTNLLNVEIRQGRASCGTLSWNASQMDGQYTFSLRPECIVPAATSQRMTEGSVHLCGKIVRRIFQGPATLLHFECGDLTLLIRVPASTEIADDQEFAFRVSDLVRLESGEQA